MGREFYVGVHLLTVLLGCPYVFCGIEEMEKHGVVPDVISVAPSEVATIKYGNLDLQLGNELTPTQVKKVPTMLQWKADPSSLYTVAMVDPDAPSRQDPKFREWQHWLVVNVPGNDISQGETLSEYIGSGPPKGTGLHRYVFLVYKQSAKIVTDNIKKLGRSADHRGKFSISKFAKEHNLGDPVAGNFYQAQWDDYVPQLYKELGDK